MDIIFQSPTDIKVAEGRRRYKLDNLSKEEDDRLRLMVNLMLRKGSFPDNPQFWNDAIFDLELLRWPYFPAPRGILSKHNTRGLEVLIRCWKTTTPSDQLPGQAATLRSLRDSYGVVWQGGNERFEFPGCWDDSHGIKHHDKRCRRILGFDPKFKPNKAGGSDKKTREAFLRRHGLTCAGCGESFSLRKLEVDHRIPRIRHRVNGTPEAYVSLSPNMTQEEQDRLFQPLCARCTERKSRACENCVGTGNIKVPAVALRYPWNKRFPVLYSGTCIDCHWYCPMREDEGETVVSDKNEIVASTDPIHRLGPGPDIDALSEWFG